MEYKSIHDIAAELLKNPVEKKGHIYHPIPFPEFSALQTSSNQKEAYKKLDLIINAVNQYFLKEIKGLKVLDLGANAGFYTFSLAKMGAKVTAFEPHARYGPIGAFIAKDKNLPVTWYNSTFKVKAVKNEYFDMALMLSVFQWMAGGGKRMEKAISKLEYISTISEVLIFELGYNKGASSIKTSRINHYAELVKLLQQNTRYNCFKLLGTTKPWGAGRRYLILGSRNKNWDDTGFAKILRRIKI